VATANTYYFKSVTIPFSYAEIVGIIFAFSTRKIINGGVYHFIAPPFITSS